MAEIQGTFDERFAGVRDVLSANLDRGADVGASVCVVHDGRTVVVEPSSRKIIKVLD